MAMEMLELPNGVIGLAAEPRGRQRRRRAPRRGHPHQRGRPGQAHRPRPPGAGRRRARRSRGQPAGRAARRQGPDPDTDASARSSSRRPGVIERQPVKEPLQTGIKAIDAMIPIGRGQRELIIGDRQTGKTSHHRRHDHQPEGPGRQSASTSPSARRPRPWSQVVDKLDAYGAMEYTIVVAATASDLGAAASTWPRTPAPPWASTSCYNGRARRRASTTTSPSTPTPTGR